MSGWVRLRRRHPAGAILVEGEFDALVWQAWFLRRTQVIEVVAWGGTSKPKPGSFARLRALGARVVYLANDDDPAGHAATRDCLRLAWAAGLEPLVMTMPPGLQRRQVRAGRRKGGEARSPPPS